MSLLVKASARGATSSRSRAIRRLKYVGFSAHRLAPGEELAVPAGDREVCLVVLSGVVTVRAGSAEFARIGRARQRLRGRPAVRGLRPRHRAAGASPRTAPPRWPSAPRPGTGVLPPRLIAPEQMRRTVRGKDLNTRYVSDILPAGRAGGERCWWWR